MTLHIAPKFDLPDDAVTQTIAILARRGAGKTYTAKVIAEEMIEHALPVVVLDPVGVWWGLRSSADGKRAGLPVTILGGDHGDLPLEAAAGKLVAGLVADEPSAVVIDLSALPSKNAQRQFATDFAEHLYRVKASNRAPLHVMIDEADEFAPQRVPAGDQRQLGAFETLVRRGRARGIGVTMITQRPAVLNKNVLTQIECLMVMQITSPQDRKALGEWVSGHAEQGEQKIVEDSLAILRQGEGWFWSPAWLGTLQRVQIRKARTFDSSATPKSGEIRREAQVLASVDLDRLKEGMDRVVKEAERNDPRRLHARIRELETELKKRPTETFTERVEVPVEVPAIDAATLSALERLTRSHSELLGQVLDGVTRLSRQPAPAATASTARSVSRAPSPPPAARHSTTVVTGDAKYGKAERAILSVLAQFPDGRTLGQIAMLTGYRPTASTIGVALSNLRKLGFVGDGNKPVRATDEGVAALGNDYEPLPQGQALLDFWKSTHLGRGEIAVLDLLIDAYPGELSHEEICRRTGYSPTASTVGVIMSKLRKLELADGWRAGDDFIDAIRS